jgi:hypothetical protein
VIVRGYVVVPPCATVWLEGEELIAKFGAVTTRVTVAVWLSVPLAPVMVNV